MTPNEHARKRELLRLDVEDRVSRLAGLDSVRRVELIDQTVGEIVQLGRALGLETKECGEIIEEVFGNKFGTGRTQRAS